jgi:ABC-2 type transport system ATP-binding protein
MVEIKQLTKLYGNLVAVDDLSFTVASGDILGLVGPNGAGKTTTLRMISGILPPTRGTVAIGGHDIKRNPVQAKKQLAFIPDEPRFFEYLTVSEHLRFTARIYHVDDFEEKHKKLIELMELGGKENALPRMLSRGMKQKLGLACALLHDPSVLILDEPLTGLDPLGIRKMKDMIIEKGRSGVSVIVSSHLLPLVEEICSHVLIIQKGKKVMEGSLKEITKLIPDPTKHAGLEEVFFAVTRKDNDEKASGDSAALSRGDRKP